MMRFAGFFFSVFYMLISVPGLSQDKPELVISSGHHESILSIDFSNDGKYVASAAADNTVKIFDRGLKQEFATLNGHNNRVNYVCFSADMKYVFSFTRSEAITWEFPSCRFLHRTALSEEYDGYGGDFTVSETGVVYWPCNSDGVFVYNLVTGTEIKTMPELDLQNGAFIEKQDLLMGKTRGEEEGECNFMFYKASSGELLSSIKLEGMWNSMLAVSHDYSLVVTDAGLGKMAIINVAAKKVVQTVQVGTTEITGMCFSPDGKRIYTVSRDNAVRIFDSNGQKIKEVLKLDNDPAQTFSMAMSLSIPAVSPDNRTLAIGYNYVSSSKICYRLGFFNTADMSKQLGYDGVAKICLTLFNDENENYLTVGSNSHPLGTRVWNLKKGELEYFYPGNCFFNPVKGITPLMYLGATTASIRLVNTNTMKDVLDIPFYGTAEPFLSPDGKYVSGDMVFGNKTTGIPEHYITTWSMADGKQISKVKYEIAALPRDLAYSPDGKIMVIHQSKIDFLDPASGKVVKTTALSTEFPNRGDYEFISDTKILYGDYEDTAMALKELDFYTGSIEVVATLPYRVSAHQVKFNAARTMLAITCHDGYDLKPNKVLVLSWPDKKVICEFKEHTAMVSRVCFGNKTNNLYAADMNGVISVWNVNDCIKKSSFLTMHQKDFMIVTPDNYYRSSAANLEGVGFRFNGKLYRFDQFDMVYNRPDIALERLGFAETAQINLFKEAYKKRLKRMGFSEDRVSARQLKAPEISIAEISNIPASVATENYTFTVNAVDSDYMLDRMHVYVNNVPLYGKKGLNVKSAAAKSLTKKIDLALNQGRNVVQVSVMNENGIESIRETFGINCDMQKPKPNLYVIAVGAKAYADSSMNLTYSDKDAEDIASTFFTSAGNQKPPYTRVFTKTLTNQQVTAENVKALKTFLKDSKVDDQVVLFFSGHGLISANLDYYLAMYDVDFANPENEGLAYEDFQHIIDSIPARKKLILLDACHSGELDKDEVATVTNKTTTEGETMETKEFATKGKKVIGMKNTNELMKELFTDLRKESGATVISSSSGKEFSLEGKEWKNGVFTYSLKLGLSSMKADKDKNNEVQISELREFISVKVKELTNGNQNPTSRQENIEFDVRIW